MFSLVPLTDCPYSNSRQLPWLSTLGADTVHGSDRGAHTHTQIDTERIKHDLVSR